MTNHTFHNDSRSDGSRRENGRDQQNSTPGHNAEQQPGVAFEPGCQQHSGEQKHGKRNLVGEFHRFDRCRGDDDGQEHHQQEAGCDVSPGGKPPMRTSFGMLKSIAGYANHSAVNPRSRARPAAPEAT